MLRIYTFFCILNNLSTYITLTRRRRYVPVSETATAIHILFWGAFSSKHLIWLDTKPVNVKQRLVWLVNNTTIKCYVHLHQIVFVLQLKSSGLIVVWSSIAVTAMTTCRTRSAEMSRDTLRSRASVTLVSIATRSASSVYGVRHLFYVQLF